MGTLTTKQGTVTYIGDALGIIVAGDTKYRYELLKYPDVILGKDVLFDVDTEVSTNNTKYAKNVKNLFVQDHVVRDLIERVSALEGLVGDLQKIKEEAKDYGSKTGT